MKSIALIALSLAHGLAVAEAATAPGSPVTSAAAEVAGSDSANKVPRDILKMRDPFKKVVVNNPSEAPKSDLEQIPLEKFKIIGVLTGSGMNHMRAILQGPNGKSYFVTENTRIGVKKGVIKRITSDAVHVREKVLNAVGEEESVERELKLQADARNLNGASW